MQLAWFYINSRYHYFTSLKYSDAGQVKHFKVSCHKNMMFAINGHNFFYTIAEMIQV